MKLPIFKNGFTLVELLVIVGILIMLAAISISALRFFQKESALNNSAEEIINTLRLAQSKTLASEEASQWGVYFYISDDLYQYILFKGASYDTRDNSFDEIYKLPRAVEIYEVNLDGQSEVVFNRLTGMSSQSGKISLRLKNDPTKIREIIVQSSGQITLAEEVLASDSDRMKDSRHVHFNYARLIDTTSEKLTLTFDGAITQEIIINENLKGGQIYWEGELNVAGETQKLKVHTHRLNDADTQFSIHRDRRFNNKSLIITISDDASGTLIEYSADGLTTTKTSIYATDPQWQ